MLRITEFSIWVLAIGVAGFVMLLAVAQRPRRLYPALLVVTVGSAGLMVEGYAIVDEILTGTILLGALMVVAVRGVAQRHGGIDRVHLGVFLALMGYLIAETVRSPLLPEDWRMVRWILYFAMLGLLAILLSAWAVPSPSRHQSAVVIAWTALLYLGAYLAHGLISEHLRATSRWALQGKEWSGSAYAMFPVVVAMPAVLFLLQEQAHRRRLVAWAALGMAIVVALYYDSRIALLVIVGYLAAAFLTLGVRRMLTLGLVSLALMTVTSWAVYFKEVGLQDVPRLGATLYQASIALWRPGENDLDRNLQLRAAIRAVEGNWQDFLIGSGTYAHRSKIRLPLQELFYAQLPGVIITEPVRTTGFAALLVDTGIIGVGLLLVNMLLAVREIFRRARLNRAALLSALVPVLMVLWLLVSNVHDIVLLYFALMPSGLSLVMAGPAAQPPSVT